MTIREMVRLPKVGERVQPKGEDRYFLIDKVEPYGNVYYKYVKEKESPYAYRIKKSIPYDKLKYDIRLGLWKQVET